MKTAIAASRDIVTTGSLLLPPEVPVSDASSTRLPPPRFCPEMEGATLEAGRSGSVSGMGSTCVVQELLVLLEYLVQNFRTGMSASEFSCVRLSNLVLCRRNERCGLGRLGGAVDGGSVRSEPDRQVLRKRLRCRRAKPCRGGGGRKGARQEADSAVSRC